MKTDLNKGPSALAGNIPCAGERLWIDMLAVLMLQAVRLLQKSGTGHSEER